MKVAYNFMYHYWFLIKYWTRIDFFELHEIHHIDLWFVCLLYDNIIN